MPDARQVLDLGTALRFTWIVVNVRDLEQSRMFYERFTPLRSYARIEGTGVTAFGVEGGTFVGDVLRDGSNPAACSVILVQWTDPLPTGHTYPSHTNPGYFRICFQHPDAGELFDAVHAAGYETLSPLRLPKPGRSTGRPVFSMRDPDGTVLEFLTFPGEPRLFHVNCNTAALDRAHAFFGETVGLECALRSTTTDLEEHSFGPGGDLHTYDARLYRAVDDGAEEPRLMFDVVESTFPTPEGHAYPSSTNVGIVRVGVEVQDLDLVHGTLAEHAPETILAAPDTWMLGAELGTRRVAVLRSPDGVPFDLVERTS
jgi:catechol 2,3-dioxygenase-like lactoylglutathione lyase family enzyme